MVVAPRCAKLLLLLLLLGPALLLRGAWQAPLRVDIVLAAALALLTLKAAPLVLWLTKAALLALQCRQRWRCRPGGGSTAAACPSTGHWGLEHGLERSLVTHSHEPSRRLRAHAVACNCRRAPHVTLVDVAVTPHVGGGRRALLFE
jgi:hypothetical protein